MLLLLCKHTANAQQVMEIQLYCFNISTWLTIKTIYFSIIHKVMQSAGYMWEKKGSKSVRLRKKKEKRKILPLLCNDEYALLLPLTHKHPLTHMQSCQFACRVCGYHTVLCQNCVVWESLGREDRNLRSCSVPSAAATRKVAFLTLSPAAAQQEKALMASALIVEAETNTLRLQREGHAARCPKTMPGIEG